MGVSEDALVVDGNAVAGLLAEIFGGAEMTGAVRGCGSCGQRHAVGKHRLYRGRGAWRGPGRFEHNCSAPGDPDRRLGPETRIGVV
jgi:hypothetical protein